MGDNRWTCILTDSGAALLAGAAGNTLKIKRAQCGAGQVAEADLAAQTAVSDVRGTLAVTEISHSANVSQVRLQLKSAGIENPFELRQIGIFGALNNDSNDVLYMLLQNSEPDTIPSVSQSPNYVYDCLVNLIVGNAESVTANVDTAAFVTTGTFAGAVEVINEKLADMVSKSAGNVVIGEDAKNDGSYCIALGVNAITVGHRTIAIGLNASANVGESIAIGWNAESSALYGVALGKSSTASGWQSLALGVDTKASGYCSTALGYNAQTSESDDYVIQLGTAYLTSGLRCKVALSVTSDERDKTDIAEIKKALDFIKKVKPIQYVDNNRNKYLPDELNEQDKELIKKYGLCHCYDDEAYENGERKGERKRVGVSAQQVQEALKEVYGTADYANLVNDNLHDVEDIPDGVESQLTVAYSNFVPFLIQSVQELSTRLEAAEKTIERLLVAQGG